MQIGPQHLPATFFVAVSVIMVMISRCCLPACTCGENGKINGIVHFGCNALGGTLNFLAFVAAADFYYEIMELSEMINGGDSGGGGGGGGISDITMQKILIIITMLFVTMVFRCQGCICGGLHQFGGACADGGKGSDEG